MIGMLKATMSLYGFGNGAFGILYLVAPDQLALVQGAENTSAYLTSTKMALGAGLAAAGVFIVIAARDPVKRLLWVKYAIALAVLFSAVAWYSGLVLFDDLGQASTGVIIHGVFALLLLALYPKASRVAQDAS
jgi:hypothetical protein